MKPAAFAYARVASLDEAFELLDRHGDEARLLAGGQSLMPTLNMRLSAPEVLVDINGVDELRGIERRGDEVRIGALTRHVEIERSELLASALPLMSRAIRYVAHPAIRNRGTLGGSIALADPAAELPACLRALNGRVILRSARGTREVAADAFFLGLFETAMAPDEVLSAVDLPIPGAGERAGFREFARRHGDYALAGLAAQTTIDAGQVAASRLAFFGVSDRPVLAVATGRALLGRAPADIGAADLEDALATDIDALSDHQASAAMRLHLANVLVRRMLTDVASP